MPTQLCPICDHSCPIYVQTKHPCLCYSGSAKIKVRMQIVFSQAGWRLEGLTRGFRDGGGDRNLPAFMVESNKKTRFTRTRHNKTNKIMTNLKTIMALAVGLAASASVSQAALYVNFSNNSLNDIQFTGGTGTGANGDIGYFGFLGGGNFHVTDSYYSNDYGVTKTAGDATGNGGNFSGGLSGKFAYTVNSIYSGINITPSGKITITGVSGGVLTGDLDWGTLESYGPKGRFGSISNDKVLFNVTGLTYTGPTGAINKDLQFLDAANEAVLALTYQFVAIDPTKTFNVSDLAKKDALYQSSYSVSLVAVPEPSTYIAGLGALALFGMTALPKRKN